MNVKHMFLILNTNINVHAKKFPQPYSTFALFGIITYPFYYCLWKYTAPQGYENLSLRLVSVFLCVLLAIHHYWPKKCRLFLPLFYYSTILYSLPFLFTFLLLKNDMSYAWSMNGLTVLILSILLLDLYALFIILSLGIAFGILVFIINGGTLQLPSDYMVLFLTYASVLVFGSIFSYRIDQIKEREKRVAAEAADRAKSEFIANVSHDIRTPLTGILSFSEYLKKNVSSIKDKQYANAIYQSGEQLLKLLNGVLEVISADTASDESLILDSFNLLDLVNDILQLELPAAHSKHLEFHSKMDEDLPILILSDRMKLHRILLNLVGNAIKFTHQGFIELKAVLLWKKKDRVGIEFSVTDTGIGIPIEMQHKAYDRFFKVSPSCQEKYTGSGIGLHIVQRYVRLLGGDIWFSSEEGKGTTFSFSLIVPIGKESVYPDNSSPELPVAKDSKKARVLLVEDNPMALMALKVQMLPFDVEIVEAVDGETAFEFIKAHPFDLIITDIGLPGISGDELVKTVRSLEEQAGLLPQLIYGLTGHALNSAIAKRCMDEGINEIIQKPMSTQTLKEIMMPYQNKGSSIVNEEDDSMNTQAEQVNLGVDMPRLEKELFEIKKYPLFDRQAAIEVLGAEDLVIAILQDFKEDLNADLVRIKQSHALGDWEGVEKFTHKIKGGACYGTLRLYYALLYLERYLKAGYRDRAEALYLQTLEVIEETTDYLEKNLF